MLLSQKFKFLIYFHNSADFASTEILSTPSDFHTIYVQTVEEKFFDLFHQLAPFLSTHRSYISETSLDCPPSFWLVDVMDMVTYTARVCEGDAK